jgi:type II secretory pathway component PulK
MLSVVAVIVSSQVRQKIMLVRRLDERDKSRLIADAGVKTAIACLKNESKKNYDALRDPWSNNSSAFKDINIGDGTCNICYNYTDARSKDVKTRWGLVDEERKININKADRFTLERLIKAVLNMDEMDAQELAASIVDWRDKDSELSIPLGSAEDEYYRNLRDSYEAKDAGFEVLEEICLVKGMSRDIFEHIKEYITIYGSGKININTASREVLVALGLDESIVARILAFRCGPDGVIGTADDNVFEDASGIVAAFSQNVRLTDSEIAGLNAAQDQFLTTRSDNFMVRCIAKLHNRKDPSGFICVINRNGKVLYSREY